MVKILTNYLHNVFEKSETVRLMRSRGIEDMLNNFKYRLRIIELNIVLPPPFLWNDNIPLITKVIRILQNPENYTPYSFDRVTKNLGVVKNVKDIKKDKSIKDIRYVKDIKNKFRLETVPDPLTFIGQGKRNCFRKLLLSKRSFNTSRSVVVPAPFLQTNQIIINRNIWISMGQPKAIVAVRYPVLDLRSLTYHKIVDICKEPVIAVPPSVTCGSNMDYDGDSLNLYSLTRRLALKECHSLIDPEQQFIVMGDIRVNFTHDELQTLVSTLGISKEKIYKWLYDTCLLTDSPKTFKIFETLRSRLLRINDILKPTVSYEFFKNLLTHFPIQSTVEDNEDDFKCRWEFLEFTRDCVFSDFTKADSWKLEHLQKMVKLVRGLNKIEYIREAFACRLSLSKSEVEYTGYTTNKLSYSMPELWYSQNGTVCYGNENKLAYPNLRRLYSPTIPYSVLYKFSVFRVIRQLYSQEK